MQTSSIAADNEKSRRLILFDALLEIREIVYTAKN